MVFGCLPKALTAGPEMDYTNSGSSDQTGMKWPLQLQEMPTL